MTPIHKMTVIIGAHNDSMNSPMILFQIQFYLAWTAWTLKLLEKSLSVRPAEEKQRMILKAFLSMEKIFSLNF